LYRPWLDWHFGEFDYNEQGNEKHAEMWVILNDSLRVAKDAQGATSKLGNSG
jgi:hypothetical protein